LLWHIFTDLATSWGTMVFHPFSRDRLAWDLLFIIDFTFTAVLLLPHLVAWTYRDPRRALRRGGLLWAILTALAALANSLVSTFLGVAFHWGLFALLSGVLAALFLAPAFKGWGFRQERAAFCRIGVAALVISLATCAVSHFLAVQQVKEFVREKNLTVEALAALPQPLSPFRWSGLVLTPEGVYQGWFNVLDSGPPAFQFFPSARNDYVARAQKLPEVQTYLWFTRFPVARYRTDGDRHIVEYTDLRFRARGSRAPSFTFRVTLNGNGDVLTRGFPDAD
ncbi:MAG: metal-dependent hydrolase, partial [Candidatus Acidiferrales bacterium]